jgi:serine-type D-Ala-D-Ala endopeptidase (penicillin-binding protein 7)
MMHKVAGELVLALLLLNITTTDVSVFMPTFARAAMPEIAGFSFSQQVARLPVADDRVLTPRKTNLAAVSVETTAQSVTVFDADSGALLYAEEPDTVRSIGSISKLMTAMVFLDTAPELSSWVIVTTDDYAGGGRAYLFYNDPVHLGDVLSASLVGSDNTATEALVRLSGVPRGEFIAKMNAKAVDMGLVSTSFIDPSGLAAENRSTAREVANILAHAATYDAITSRTQMAVADIVHSSGRSVAVPSTDDLLTSSFVASGFNILVAKTGFIPQAGYCFTGAFVYNNRRIYTTVLGADSKENRFVDAANVTDWVTKVYTWPTKL